MAYLYDTLLRFGLKPNKEFEFNKDTDSLMLVNAAGVHKLVKRRYHVKQRKLHISMIPDDTGIVTTALVSVSDANKRPGFWHVILDATGRPVAEHPLTYSKTEMKPYDPEDDPSVASNQAVDPTMVETTGDLARLLISWFVGYDRVNDADSAAILEILGVHALSPREIRISFPTRSIAQRMHDELVCFEDDVNGIPGATAQAARLREKLTRLLTGDTL